MHEARKGQLETELLKAYFPKADKYIIKALRKWCNENDVALVNLNFINKLENVIGSIIRHKETEYESMVKVMGKKNARFCIQPIIENRLKSIIKTNH